MLSTKELIWGLAKLTLSVVAFVGALAGVGWFTGQTIEIYGGLEAPWSKYMTFALPITVICGIVVSLFVYDRSTITE